MKNRAFTLVLLLLCTTGFGKNFKFEYSEGFNSKVKMERLFEVTSVSEITPGFWQKLQLPYKERQELEFRKKTDFTQSGIVNQNDFDYNKIVEYVSVEISAPVNGRLMSAQNSGSLLTYMQKQIIRTATPGTDINIKVSFKFKNQAGKSTAKEDKIVNGNLVVTVVPETEAEFPGGFDQLSDYFNRNIFNKISSESEINKILLASVKFTIDEDGRITDTKISQSSTDQNINKMILEQTAKMPKWNPAKNSAGAKIRQEFEIRFGGPGC